MFAIDQAEQSREPMSTLPAGFYRVVVGDVDLKNSKTGTGNYFEFVLTVVAPSANERAKLWHRLTFNNKSDTAVQIGRAQLADLLFTLQAKAFDSVEQLRTLVQGKELVVEVENEIQGDNEYNRVIGTWSLGGKHRNDKRNLAEVKLGASGKAPKHMKAKAGGFQAQAHHEAMDVPF